MKRRVFSAVVVLLMVCTVASASISVTWANNGLVYGPGGPGTFDYIGVSESYTVQLLWSANDPVTSGYMADMTTVNNLDASGNEWLLREEDLAAADKYTAWGFFSPAEYSSTAVGGAAFDGTIENGYVYARVFTDSTMDGDTRYWQAPAATPRPYPQFDDGDPNTPPGNAFTYELLTAQQDATASTQLVPEPGSLFLFAVGLATLGIKRKFRK